MSSITHYKWKCNKHTCAHTHTHIHIHTHTHTHTHTHACARVEQGSLCREVGALTLGNDFLWREQMSGPVQAGASASQLPSHFKTDRVESTEQALTARNNAFFPLKSTLRVGLSSLTAPYCFSEWELRRNREDCARSAVILQGDKMSHDFPPSHPQCYKRRQDMIRHSSIQFLSHSLSDHFVEICVPLTVLHWSGGPRNFPRVSEQVSKQALLKDTLAGGSCHFVNCLFISSFEPE